MAGIYFHVPFCKKACHYCDFHFSTSLRSKKAVVESMKMELLNRKDYLPKEPVETIYFGGGTPSLLTKDELRQLLKLVHDEFEVKSPEITLEANPDDLTKEKLSDLAEVGINRLSIGIQSFVDEHLDWMNRAHTGQQAKTVVRHAQEAGIENITIDLIYGFPLLTAQQWLDNIVAAIELNVPHISAYNLTVEQGTNLAYRIQQAKEKGLSDDQALGEFKTLIKELAKAGYEQYEISNFAKSGSYSKHNSAYWKGKAYLGIGPSAHSFNGIAQRRWNVSSNKKYVDGLKLDKPYFEMEELNERDQFNEYVLTRLRTKWGIDLTEMKAFFPTYVTASFFNLIEKLKKQELIQKQNQILSLTQKGKYLTDKITSDLFVIE